MRCLLYLMIAGLLTGCATTRGEVSTSTRPPMASRTIPVSESVWDELRENLGLTEVQHPRLQDQIDGLADNTRYINSVSASSTPYLHYVLEELDRRGLPAELAFIPMIESHYRPDAVSPGKAAGLWQIRPATGRNLGLTMNGWYDGRHDVRDSTRAALDYLEYLHRMFDEDWLLAIAAYNSGEGTVQRAMRRNRAAGKPEAYWDLPLPAITREYVPRILALSRVVAEADDYGITLPEGNNPALVEVALAPGTNVSAAARAAGLDADEVRRYNAGLKGNVIPDDTPFALLLPADQARALEALAAREGLPVGSGRPAAIASQGGEYQVRPGDTVSQIARRHGLDGRSLARWNRLDNDGVIRPGQRLTLVDPASG